MTLMLFSFCLWMMISCERSPDDELFEIPVVTIETLSNAPVQTKESYVEAFVTVKRSRRDQSMINVPARIKLRGNSTLNYDKKAYKIKFDEKSHPLELGSGPARDFVLLAEYADLSMMRNTIAYGLAKRMLRTSFVTETRYVHVSLNDESLGLYVLAEQTEVDDVRLDLDTSGEFDPFKTDTGYLLELEADTRRRQTEGILMRDFFPVFGYTDLELELGYWNFNDYILSYESAWYVVKSDAKSEAQISYIQSVVTSLYDAIYKTKTKEAVEQFMDIDSAVDMLLFLLIVSDNDANYSSMYLYKDAHARLVVGPPWDYDLAFGNNMGYHEPDRYHMVHFLDKLSTYPWFQGLIIERYEALNEDVDLKQSLLDEIKRIQTQYKDAIVSDRNMWLNTRQDGGWHFYNKAGIDDWEVAVSTLEDWIIDRFVFVESYLLEISL